MMAVMFFALGSVAFSNGERSRDPRWRVFWYVVTLFYVVVVWLWWKWPNGRPA